MAGIEYGSLGAMVVTGEDLPRVVSEIETAIRLTAAVPSFDDIPPYLFDDDFQEFVRGRATELMAVTSEIAGIVADLSLPDGAKTIFPAHHLYFYLQFDLAVFTDLEKVQKILLNLFVLKGLQFRIMPSFGFDHLVVGPPQRDDVTKTAFLRLSPGRGEDRAVLVAEALRLLFERLSKPT